jgi:hypothetical protein
MGGRGGFGILSTSVLFALLIDLVGVEESAGLKADI